MSRSSLRRFRRVATLLSLTTVGLAACGAATPRQSVAPPGAGPQATMTMPMPAAPAAAKSAPVPADSVTIQNFAFAPGAITVKAGTTVTWTNHDDEAHTVFFAFDGSRSPILVNNANAYHKTFPVPGTYAYHCTIHPFMTGTVVVTA